MWYKILSGLLSLVLFFCFYGMFLWFRRDYIRAKEIVYEEFLNKKEDRK